MKTEERRNFTRKCSEYFCWNIEEEKHEDSLEIKNDEKQKQRETKTKRNKEEKTKTITKDQKE